MSASYVAIRGPADNDGDGLLDEDPEEDLNGDGVIHQVRWRARSSEDDNGMLCGTTPRPPRLPV